MGLNKNLVAYFSLEWPVLVTNTKCNQINYFIMYYNECSGDVVWIKLNIKEFIL